MALPKSKRPIKPNKLKKLLFVRAWCRGATAKWKIGFYEKRSDKNIEGLE